MKQITKLLSIFMLTLFMMFAANAGTILTDQDVTQNNFFNTGVGNIQTFALIGNENNQYTINNNTEQYDERYEFSQIGTDIFFSYYNTVPNTTLELGYFPDVDSLESSGINYIITMEDEGTYYFQLVPSATLENAILEFDLQNGTAGLLSIHHTKDVYVESVTAVLNKFINKVLELIDLNLILINLAIYFISFVVVIFFLFSVINFLINLHNKIAEARKAKEQHFKKRRED